VGGVRAAELDVVLDGIGKQIDMLPIKETRK